MSSYRIFGSELSPYSVKVRSYCRYKGIPHEWILRAPANEDEFQRYAKLPLIPLVVTPEGAGLQDSTPIIEALEARFPDPALDPAEPVGAFVSALLEEYGDEWVNKPMFHYRWLADVDQVSAATRIAQSRFALAEGPALDKAVQSIRERMVPRLSFVGSSPATAGVIEGSYARLLAGLERHLAGRPYLFGSRPALGDFGLSAQLYECLTDPTAGGILRRDAPAVAAWCTRMLDPGQGGAFEPWSALGPTLEPILAEEVAGVFLPWSAANAEAVKTGAERFEVTLRGEVFSQAPQKYHARSLAAIRGRYAKLAADETLRSVTQRTGCLPWLVT